MGVYWDVTPWGHPAKHPRRHHSSVEVLNVIIFWDIEPCSPRESTFQRNLLPSYLKEKREVIALCLHSISLCSRSHSNIPEYGTLHISAKDRFSQPTLNSIPATEHGYL
jgi:hypothetical protein